MPQPVTNPQHLVIDDLFGFDNGTALVRFTRDLTADARAGRLEPVRRREREVARVIDILLRHGKNNPTLVGPAGVGKTAIADGLAQRVASGQVPVSLRDVRILSLDHVGLLAGTTYRGQYESRVRSLISETTAGGNIILFIDELHNLIGQGTGEGVAMDAANMLKPSLVRGDFRVIGATTSAEYGRWIDGDPALARRFQKIVVTELDDDATIEILNARKERLERHHNVLIADDAVRAAVLLTDRYITDRLRPDKAIDAVDEACAHMQAATAYSAETESLIRERLRLVRQEAGRHTPDARSRTEEASETSPRDDRAGYVSDPAPKAEPFDGISALVRFGAGLEAIFVGAAPPRPAAPGPRPSANGQSGYGASPASPRPAPPTRTLASVESALSRRLMDEGIVVRGHDIARVVGLMSGGDVTWEPEA